MAIEVIQVHGGDAVDANDSDPKKDKSDVAYFVTGTTDKYAAYAAAAAAIPSSDGALVRDSINLKHIEAEHWEVTANYVAIEKQKKDPDIGELEWDFDTTGGTQHITSSYGTIYDFHDPGWNPLEFQNAIGVGKKKHGYEVAGVDIVVPKLELTCTTSFAPGVVTIEWIRDTARMTGKTNDGEWKTFDKGELLFMGARIKTKYREKTTVTFTFSASEAITIADNVTVGGIGVGQLLGPIEKNGHEHMWVSWRQDDINDSVVMTPVQVNIESIYKETDFGELGLGN